MFTKLFQVLILSLLISLTGIACSSQDNRKPSGEKVQFNKDDKLGQYFINENRGKEVIKYARRDLNDDGREDLVVIYRVSADKNMMRVILDLSGKYAATNEVPAPYSNQLIQFKNIDNKPPMEFIVQGARGAKMGYAIFRIEGTVLKDIFGEGMRDCC